VVKPLQKWENRSQVGKTAPKLVNVKKGTNFQVTIKMKPTPGTDVSGGKISDECATERCLDSC